MLRPATLSPTQCCHRTWWDGYYPHTLSSPITSLQWSVGLRPQRRELRAAPSGLTQTSLRVALGHFGRSGQRFCQASGQQSQQSGQRVGATVGTNLDRTTNKDETGWKLETQGHPRISVAHWNPRNYFSRRGMLTSCSSLSLDFMQRLCE